MRRLIAKNSAALIPKSINNYEGYLPSLTAIFQSIGIGNFERYTIINAKLNNLEQDYIVLSFCT